LTAVCHLASLEAVLDDPESSSYRSRACSTTFGE
jgi:hypothetical protein